MSEELKLKPISEAAFPRALELAERYRLLNEPEQASSICRDVLTADPKNAVALRTLLLATTDQFGKHHGAQFADAEQIVAQMETEYDKAYYFGIAQERWARARLQHKEHLSLIGDWLRRAMVSYERAEACRPENNEDALLRWNACARLMARVPELRHVPEQIHLIGD